MTVINTNVNALFAKNAITGNSRELSTAMERLSTGNRINSAKDDAAGLAISTRMNSQTRGLSMAIRNANDGISLMQTTEGALGEVSDILQRMRELAVQASNGTNNASDRVALNDEVQQLKSEIERIATSTEFNNQKLLDGSFKNKSLQIGDKAGQTLAVEISSARLKDLGLGGTAGTSDALVGARVTYAASGVVDIAAGDILINDQALDAIDVSEVDLEDIIENINQNVDNVVASAFNVVVANSIGDGVTVDGDIEIQVTALGASASTTYSISASDSLAELVDNINNEAGGVVQASINEYGKLVLSNTTGAAISIEDTSATAGTYDGGSGFLATATSFAGFLKLESKDGSPVRITRGDLGTVDDLEALGFRETSSDYATGEDAYTITGESLTSAGVGGAWAASDITINGVAIYDADIDTSSFAGKLEAINNFSDETGVVATAYFDQTVTYAAPTAGDAGSFYLNGVTHAVTTAMSAGGFAALINTKSDVHGITAEYLSSTSVRLTGSNVTSVTTQGTAGSIGGFTAGTTLYAAIRLDSTNNRPISIALGDSHTPVEHGLLEANVGAADFQVNAPTMGVTSGSSLTGLDVSTTSSAAKALVSIDAALDTVSGMRSKLGALQNRLDSTVDNLSNVVANTEASRSRIQDTDYAAETTQLAKAQIIQQAATAMLAQANQQAQTVLSLLQ
jgi:flagellin